MKERILQFLNREQITSTQFADNIGVQRSSVSHILSGRNNPSFDFIRKILGSYTTLNAEWLILGVGEMYKERESSELFEQENVEKEEDTLPRTMDPGPEPIRSEPEKDDGKPVDIERVVIFYKNNTFTEYHPVKP